ncbi:hypothetical protein [Geothrix sp. SG200]|uniref:hypothetical protein n=1 Tax=Geothrix sp. SG200 TaxID=2922865 RepID=UPI001FAD5A5D|nr:hypothetical protein [Geothrix sp. SG200]
MNKIVVAAIGCAILISGGCDWANVSRQEVGASRDVEWQPYLGSDRSGVEAFQIGEEFIKIRFRNKRVYTYSTKRIHPSKIDQMKALASEGRGLNTFVNQNPDVRHGFDRE